MTIYINGQKATKNDLATLAEWVKRGIVKAKARTTKKGNFSIITEG